MSITREFIKGFNIEGISEDFIEGIMREYGNTVNPLNAQISAYKKDYIERTEYDKIAGERDAANTNLKKFENIDVEKLNTTITELTAAKNNLETEHTKLKDEYGNYKKSSALDVQLREGLAGLKFSSSYAKNGIYHDIKGLVKLEGDDEKGFSITGFDEAIEKMKTEKPDAFVVEIDNNNGSGNNGKRGDGGGRHKEGGDKGNPKPVKTLI
jgi:hypothetical protein